MRYEKFNCSLFLMTKNIELCLSKMTAEACLLGTFLFRGMTGNDHGQV
jgi:hypothetical protein